MNDTLLEKIQTLQHQAERLEQEATELRQALAHVAEVLLSPSSVVVRYVIEGETYEITQADVEAVRTELAKPWTESALYELAAVKKVAKKLRERSPEEQKQHFFKTVEAIRAAALANGTAIDTEAEAVIGD
jgi:hypothetical protein